MKNPRRLLMASTISLGAVALLLASAAYVLTEQAATLPSQDETLSKMRREAIPLATEVLDAKGRRIGSFFRQRRFWAPISDLPETLIQAFIAMEDQDFYEHRGIAPKAILRAAIRNVTGGRLSQGASTITQQLARSLFLTREKTMTRKVREVLLALWIDDHYSKRAILELYLNLIYLGAGSYGVEAAAQRYFRKSARDLDVGESALLAALPRAPSRLAPHRAYRSAHRRQHEVLRRMHEEGFLDARGFAHWRKKPVRVYKKGRPIQGGYLLAQARTELTRDLSWSGVHEEGLKIYTTVDLGLQEALRSQIPQALNTLPDAHLFQGAGVIVDGRTGGILAMQGGTRFSTTQFNRATQMRRGLGSAFAPMAIAAAMEQGAALDAEVAPGVPLMGVQAAGEDPLRLLVAQVGQQDMERFVQLHAGLGRPPVVDREFEWLKVTPLEVAQVYNRLLFGSSASPHLIRTVRSASGTVLFSRDDAPAPSKARLSYIFRHFVRTQGHVLVGSTRDRHNGWAIGDLGGRTAVLWLGSEFGQAPLAADVAGSEDLMRGHWRGFASRFADSPAQAAPPPGISFRRPRLAQGASTSPIPIRF